GYLTAYNAGWDPANSSPQTHLFTGTLNAAPDGTPISKSVSAMVNSWNLVGNPFPSSINWQAASGWTRTNLVENGTLYYDMWIYNPDAGNYGVCNSLPGSSGTNSVTNIIAPMQAFFVKAVSTGNLVMANTVQVHSAQSWLKSGMLDENLLRLSLNTSANNFSDEMIVAVSPSFENEGSQKFWSIYSEAPEIYCIKGDVNYSIDRLTSVNETSVVSIGIRAGLDAGYTFKATGVENFFTAKSVLLEDLKTGQTQELKDFPIYTFSAKPGDAAERFHLHFGGPFGIDEQKNPSDFKIFSYENSVYLKNISGGNLNGEINIYNILGQRILQKRLIDNITRIDLNAPSGCYIVTLVANNKIYSQKVFIH
ncbi:MAG: T9SS type A sorting domain-containing protein, partial [Bacteroidota bacterium]